MQLVRDGDLVLMDAGNEYFGYCSDLTRTWPVSGVFTTQQRDVYEVVRDTHRSAKHLLSSAISRACVKDGTLLRQHQHRTTCMHTQNQLRNVFLCSSRYS